MRVVNVPRFGGPDVLEIVEKPTPTAEAGQVVLRVRAAGINFADTVAREGKYPPGPPPPFTPGFEVAGTVTEIGSDVTSFAIGQRVLGMVPWAGYAEYAVLDAAQAIPLPDNLDYAPATALLIQGLTAYFLLDAAHFAPGESVLVNAAAGGVGSLAVQIAKLRGAGTVIGTASTDEKRRLVTETFGADAAVDYTQPGWAAKVRDITGGKGVSIFLDATGDIAGEGSRTLANRGRWMVYGAQQGQFSGLDAEALSKLLFTSKTLTGFSLYDWMDPAPLQKALSTLVTWAAHDQLKIIANDRFPLEEVAAAHTALTTRQTTGKVVLEP